MKPGNSHDLVGLATILGLAGVATFIASIIPHTSALIVAIAAGFLLANVPRIPDVVTSGTQHNKLLLEIGIVLLGARLTLDQLLDTGPTLAVLAISVVVLGILFAELVSRLVMGFDGRTGSLLAAGASICGVSAVVAVARSIDANEEKIAYVAGTILLLDAVTLVAFPLVATILDLPAQTFGIWAGLSMFSTGPAVAAGFTHSPAAAEWATITKIIRNSLVGFAAVGYSLFYAHTSTNADAAKPTVLWEQFPKFLIGFFMVVLIANAGVLGPSQIEGIKSMSTWLFTMAFAGLGLEIQVDHIRNVGVRPLVMMVIHVLVIGSLTLISLLYLL